MLDRDEITEPPERFLSRVGTVFRLFAWPDQDSGNVSYGVEVGGRRFFVKTAGEPDDERPALTHGERVELLRNAESLAASCDHPALAPLRRTIASPVGPMLVYDWAEGELLRAPRERRDDPATAYQRFRALPAERLASGLDTVFELHRDLAALGWVAVDLYDGCLIYDFAQHRLTIVDLDMYRRGPSANDRGRMFGSTRFMAPEEFELGAPIDEVTNVFTLGRFAAVFLGDGTLSREAFRGSDALHAVVAQACLESRQQRFGSVAAFHDAWRAARSEG